jgi:hypothetical protein
MRVTNTILACLLIAMVGGSCRMIDALGWLPVRATPNNHKLRFAW